MFFPVKNNLKKVSIRTLIKSLSILWLVCVFFNPVFALDEGNTTPGGTIIVNRAEANYLDEDGTIYSTVSQTVSVTVLSVPAVTVTPDETVPSETIAPNDRITRLFKICNTGNIEDSFLPIRAEISSPAVITNIYFDADNSGTITEADTPVQINSTLTPPLAPHTCQTVLFAIETNQIAVQSQAVITLTARSSLTLPGDGKTFAEDSGKIINVVGNAVTFTSPLNASLPPSKLVENLPQTTASAAQILNYSISFRNSGSVAARQVRVVDDLPAELEYVSNTLRLSNRTLTDAADSDEGAATARRVELLIPEIAPDAVTLIQFQARLIGANTNGSGVVNNANISASNAVAVRTSDAIAIINPVGTVYAGNSSGATKIAGAQILIATDETATPLNLTPNIGYAPNQENINPFDSDQNGNFSFALAENQTGTQTNPARYFVNITAPNYRSRLLEVLISPNENGGLYKASVRALDGQAIAIAGGFALTGETIELRNLAALVFNIPMFELSTLEITKSADKQFAEIGDIVSYRVQVKNATASTIGNVVIQDTLPAYFVYASGTTQIEIDGNRRVIEPIVETNQLTFRIGELAAGANAIVSYRIRIGASAREGEHYNFAVASGTQPNGETVATQPAKVAVRVRGGVFSMRQIIIGRVFEDRNRNGKFDEGERPVAGARIYMNNGQSVITDSAGQYNLPAVSSGAIVLSLDPITLPQNYNLLDDEGRKSAKSWTRLLTTPLGGGGLLRQNFAIAASEESLVVADDVKIITAKGVFIPKNKKKTDNAKNEAERETPVQIASLKNKISLNIPSKTDEKQSSETYTIETSENIDAVEPGNLLVLSPQIESVVMSAALSLVARVAKDWTIEALVNGERVDTTNLGESRIDNRNNVATFSFVGINLIPGANTVRLTAIGANGERGTTSEFKVFGRGAVEKLEIVPSKAEAQSGGLDSVKIEIRGFDRWGNPAADGQIAVETSAGRIFAKRSSDNEKDSDAPVRQQTISLENGVAIIELVGDGTADTARLKAIAGQREVFTDIRFTTEMRPTLMLGLGELSVGQNAPAISSTGDEANYRARVAFYYRGRIFNTKNLLTLAYDSQQPLNRVAGRDRFGDFNPTDRAYPIFGDSSQRFEDAQSNSKIYARVDRGRSYAMFGDMETDMQELSLAGYSRRLTGVKLFLENKTGDFISVTGARPDTAFARDVIPGGSLSIVRLSHADILQGSEVVSLEIRDRRNPEIIIRREQFIRSIDYNIDELTGEIFFLRPISTFDYQLNLSQIVATYEYRGVGKSNYVYTGRALKNFKQFGLRIGFSYLNQQQAEIGAFQVGGINIEKTLPLGGKLDVEAALSSGRYASDANVFDFYNNVFSTDNSSDSSAKRNGTAFRVRLDQPLPFFRSRLRADFQNASTNFYNPFGTTVTPGSERLQIALEMRPVEHRTFSLGFTSEHNQTRNVDNSRETFSFLWSEQWNAKLRTSLGFDRRYFADDLADKTIDSNLITAAIEYRPTEKLDFSVKREQNLGEADPTYPNQTTFAANYQFRPNTKLFFTQRLASAPITPIGDFSGNGFSSVGSRYETAFGIETKLSRIGALSGRYQIENGVSGLDSFAVVGLENRWALTKTLSVEAGFERGFLLAGDGKSFNSATFGASWTPNDGFRTSARYELRDRNGLGQLFSVGAAGKIGDNWTTLVRGQWTRSNFYRSRGASSNLTAAAAYRPIDSDRFALLFSYNRRENEQEAINLNNIRQTAVRDRLDTLSTDGIYQISKDTEIYGRFALRFNANGSETNQYASALTFLAQMRAQQKLGDKLDFAAEYRMLAQPASNTFRRSFGTEIGYWIIPDLRFGAGYNFTQTAEMNNINTNNNPQFRGGFYFTITSKLSNLFDLFGTSRNGLQNSGSDTNERLAKKDSSEKEQPNK
jgi:uncharacterized repeat protein (TIGR01451 family)